ncbi:MAG TPA: NADH-quinone oxidoreductase subunit M [Candidatus Acidoferrales bacterium]|jgi:NADH-quinone oxidoreductase subunit M|nr:NADH-quinone oxidoreductase subunit M [Candidatus Acidoferrales bacterium]
MEFYNTHILTVVLFTPLVGALALLFVPRDSANAHRVVGNLFAFLGLIVSLPLIWRFSLDPGAARYQFAESADWIPSIGARYSLGIDGISLLLVILTTFLGAISILSSWSAIKMRTKEYYILFLLLQVGMLGVFMSLDFFLFYMFWEVMLVPMYFLIGVWGSDRRLYAAIKFFLYTLVGSVIMLLGVLALYFKAGANTFDMPTLLASASKFDTHTQVLLFWAFFFAFAIKVPMFPFHTWLPDAHTEAPTAGSVILAGVLLKMGTYGFIRFSLPLLPQDPAARHKIVTIMLVLSIIGIIYGALVCMMQKDMKKLVAYSSVSHLAFCTLGIFALTPHGLSGSVIQQINHGISTGALFLLIGVLYERRHTRLISEFGGLSTPMPNFAAIYMIASLSSLGLPLLNGFIGEFTILRGTYEVSIRYTAWASFGIVLGAAYLLWLYQRVMFGPVTNPANEHMADLNWREYATLLPLVFLMFWIGIYPKPLFRFLDRPVQDIVTQVNPGYYGAERAASPGATPALAPAPAATGVMDMPGMPTMSMPAMDMPSGSNGSPASPTDKK